MESSAKYSEELYRLDKKIEAPRLLSVDHYWEVGKLAWTQNCPCSLLGELQKLLYTSPA